MPFIKNLKAYIPNANKAPLVTIKLQLFASVYNAIDLDKQVIYVYSSTLLAFFFYFPDIRCMDSEQNR